MSVKVLFAARSERWPSYETPLTQALQKAGVDAVVAPDLAPQDVDYIVYAPNSDVQDFSLFPKLKAVLSLWAGVEAVVSKPTLTVPLTRMVDTGLTNGMVEWVTGHVLRHHLGMDDHIHNPDRIWKPVAPPLAADRPVTILGIGALGTACAQMLTQIGFPVRGWSRSAKQIDGVSCYHGRDGLRAALEDAQIVVLLLPDTPATQNILDERALSWLAAGAVVINPGRGPLIDDEALLGALDTGHIAHATLDVFRTEPLPQDHPYWRHPRVTVTPHVASETRETTASQCIAENIRRCEAGQTLLHIVDRDLGY